VWRRDDLQLGCVRLEALRHSPREPGYPTLVFLHEGLGCSAMWRDFPQLLCESTGCAGLVYTRQGYGDSDPCALPRPLNYMHIEALQVLPAVLASADIGNYIVVGHSDGASIGLIHAGSPGVENLKGLVSIAPHAFCEELTVQSIRKARTAYMEGELATRLAKYHRENTECAFWGWNEAWLDPRFRDWNITEYLPRITAPQLVVHGGDDEYGTLAQVDTIVAQSGGEVQIEILDQCGHNPCRDRTVSCLALMSDFIHLVR